MTLAQAGNGRSIDWAAVRERLALQQAALQEAFDGKGPWAEALLRRRAAQFLDGDGVETAPGTLPVLIVRAAGTTYALEIRQLGRILPLPRVAPVPGAPPELAGLIAIGGRVMRLFDLDRLCGGPGIGADGVEAGGYVVTLRHSARLAALRIETVETVRDIAPDALRPADGGRYIKAVAEERTALLDVAAILEWVNGSGESWG